MSEFWIAEQRCCESDHSLSTVRPKVELASRPSFDVPRKSHACSVAGMKPKFDPLAAFRSLPLFAHCTAEELGLVDSLADEVRIGAGRDLAKQGELGREFVLITDGTAAVIRDEVEIGTLGPGDYFGELALLDDQPRNATVRAVSDLTAQVLDRRAFQTLLDDSPHMTRNLLSATAMRLAECDEEIARLRKRLAESVDSD